ncbi:unnamed protein product [Tilletia controversa]|nr:unnamed protein product [Tilletia controversa]
MMRYDTTQASRSRSSTEIRKLHSHIATPLSSSHSSAESRRSRARPETPLSSSDEEEAFQHVGFEYGSEVGSDRSGFTSQMEPRRPFAYFRPKVDALIRGLQDLGLLPPSLNVRILCLPGSPTYRLFRISLDSDAPRILHIARRSDYDLRPASNVICRLRKHAYLPVPELLFRQRTSDNVLGRPWMMTSDVPGVALDSVYWTMSIQERSSIAWQLAKLITDIACTPAPEQMGPAVVDGFGNRVIQARATPSLPFRTLLPHIRAPAQDSVTPGYDRHDRSDVPASLSSNWLRLIKKKKSCPTFRGTGPTIESQKAASVFSAFRHEMSSDSEGSDKQELVFFHPGLDPRNIYVQLSGNPWASSSTGQFFHQWTISGVISWEGCRVSTIGEAFKMPEFLTEQPCSNTRLCRSGCTCVANASFAANAAEHVRQYFQNGLREYGGQILQVGHNYSTGSFSGSPLLVRSIFAPYLNSTVS